MYPSIPVYDTINLFWENYEVFSNSYSFCFYSNVSLQTGERRLVHFKPIKGRYESVIRFQQSKAWLVKSHEAEKEMLQALKQGFVLTCWFSQHKPLRVTVNIIPYCFVPHMLLKTCNSDNPKQTLLLEVQGVCLMDPQIKRESRTSAFSWPITVQMLRSQTHTHLEKSRLLFSLLLPELSYYHILDFEPDPPRGYESSFFTSIETSTGVLAFSNLSYN